MSKWRVWLLLGRVSNLPTVWSNVLASTSLVGYEINLTIVVLIFSVSMFYVGGMLLNDAFDRSIDSLQRPERPIPSGKVAASSVFTVGFTLLALGWVLLWLFGVVTALIGVALIACIITYDWHHKGVAWSPWLMGACRALIYVVAGYAASAIPDPRLYLAALVLAGYVAGLSYAAKQENLAEFKAVWPLVLLGMPIPCLVMWDKNQAWLLILIFASWIGWSLSFLFQIAHRNNRRAVEGLIAGISLLDAVLIYEFGSPTLAGAALFAFLLTCLWQHRVPGT